MVTMARSRSIWGPYEADPENPVLTSDTEDPDAPQKCGHGDLVCTQNGEWYMVHLGSRPPGGTRQCVLGRETFLQKVVWNEEGWLRLAGGGRFAKYETERPQGIPVYHFPESEADDGCDDFEVWEDRSRYSSLRIPWDEFTSWDERPGYLRLYGQESLNSCFHVSLMAHRQQARLVKAEICLEFLPECREQAAGLAYLYDTRNFYLLIKTGERTVGETPGKSVLKLMKSCNGEIAEVIPETQIPEDRPLYLRAVTIREGLDVQFFYSLDGREYRKLAEVPTDILTDEHCIGFTGAHFGVYCHDMTGKRNYADFKIKKAGVPLTADF